MSSFRFNFSNETDAEYPPDNPSQQIQWRECEEITPSNKIKDIDDMVTHAKMFTCGDVEIGHVIVSDTINRIIKSDNLGNSIELAEKEHSDLIAGVYEGGIKIWECTYDLMEFLIEDSNQIQFCDTNVLDLGCGAGILGIHALMNGANVTFQDYNKEILESVTIPNVLLNTEEETTKDYIKKCKFYSGDWASFNDKLPNESYDLILTSETIYNPSNYNKLIDLFSKKLKSNGTVYVAAKTCYFGVGGGTRLFETAVEQNGLFKTEICWKNTSGIQREIIKIIFK